MQTFECKQDGNNERVVDDRSRETVLCAAAAAALGRASERAEAAAAGLEEDGEEAGVCANLSYAWVSSQALVCIRMSNALSLA
jgi:hypothetical protein